MSQHSEARYQLILLEVQQVHRRADHFKLRIETKAYLSRVGHVFRGCMTDPEQRPLTEAEVLADEVSTHDAHIRRAEDLLDEAKRLLATFRHEDDSVIRFGNQTYAGRQRVG